MSFRLLLVSCVLFFALAPTRSFAQLDDDDLVVVSPDLRSTIGPSAHVLLAEAGHVRMIHGAHITGSGEPSDRAIALVRRLAPELGLPPDVELVVENDVSAHGFRIFHLARFDHGIRVRDAGAVVRFLSDGAIDLVLGHPGARGLVSGAVTVTEERAREIATAAGLTVLEIRPELHSSDVGLVPVFTVVTTEGPETTLREMLVDARDGHVVLRVPLVVEALGTVYARNRTSDASVTTDVELPDLTSTTALTGTYFRAFNCAANASGCTGTQAMPDASGDYLFMPEVGSYTDPFAEVSAYHHASRVAAYFRDVHGFTWRCDGSTRMELLVNYTERPSVPYDNAAYSGGFGGGCGSLLFGQGATGDFAWDGDVVYHEFGHAVTDSLTSIAGFTSDTLGISYEPGAVNEGSSDYWAAAVQGDGSIAESFSGLGGIGAHGSLRVIDADLTCPADLLGEGHFDGRLWAGLGWHVREMITPEDADALFFATIATIDSSPSLSDAAVLYRATAMSLMTMGSFDATELAVVDAEIATRGLEGCRRIVPLDDLGEHRAYSGSSFFTGGVGRGITPLHFSLDVPVDATSATVLAARVTVAGNYRLHFRAGSPVRVGSRITSSWSVDVGPSGAVVIDESTPLVLPRCSTLYVAVEVLDLDSGGESLFGVQAMLTQSGDPSATCPEIPDAGPPAGTDTGTADAGGTIVGAGSGCGCHAGSRAPGALVVLVGLAIAAAARRRR